MIPEEEDPKTPDQIEKMAIAIRLDKKMRASVIRVNGLLLVKAITGNHPLRIAHKDMGSSNEERELVVAAFTFHGWEIVDIFDSIGGFVGYDFSKKTP